MSKRAFIRQRGTLCDDYEDPPGSKFTICMLASMVGEEISAEDRAAVLARARSPLGSAYGLHEDQSSDVLEGALDGVNKLNSSTPMDLMRFLEDGRVQPALVDAARRAPGDCLANFAQVVGLIGGPGSREVLRERLAELSIDPDTFLDHSFFNSKAGALATTACALLGLEPDADVAAEALLRLFQHPCGFNRRSAFMNAVPLVQRGQATRTKAMRRLAEAIDAAAGTDDDELFLILCDRTYWLSPGLNERLGRLLVHGSRDLRERAVQVLSQPPLVSAATLCQLRDRLPLEPSLRLRIRIAGHLGPLLATVDLAALVAEGLADESPSLRHKAIGMLHSLPSPAATELAQRAEVDEPDPALKRLLEEWSRQVESHPA